MNEENLDDPDEVFLDLDLIEDFDFAVAFDFVEMEFDFEVEIGVDFTEESELDSILTDLGSIICTELGNVEIDC
jgi:hypothetical protein